MAYDVFISYSRKDAKIADEICTALSAAGLTFFIDKEFGEIPFDIFFLLTLKECI